MFEFQHTINGVEVTIVVTHYKEEVPMKITGWGYGDADPPEPAEFDYNVEYLDGYPYQEEISDEDDEAIYLKFLEIK